MGFLEPSPQAQATHQTSPFYADPLLPQMLPSYPQWPWSKRTRSCLSQGHWWALRLQDPLQGTKPAPVLGNHRHSRRPAPSPQALRLWRNLVRPNDGLTVKYCFQTPPPIPC